MAKRMVVLFDVDGVLAWFTKSFYDVCGVPVPQGGHPTSYDIHDGITEESSRKAWDYISGSWNFWANIPLLCSKEEIRRVAEMSISHDIYFVTNRFGVRAKQQTEYWLEQYKIHNPTVIISDRKGEVASAVGADYAIEDKAGNAVAIAYMARKCKSYIIDRPYNQFGEAIGTKVIRIKTVSEFIDNVESDW